MFLKNIFERFRCKLIEPSYEFKILSEEIDRLECLNSRLDHELNSMRMEMVQYYKEISETHYENADYMLNEMEYIKSLIPDNRPMLKKKAPKKKY